MLRYCTRCVLPDSKPDLHLDDEGICNACRAYEFRTEIDWNSRYKELLNLLDQYKSKSQESWDCIVPVSASGGAGNYQHLVEAITIGGASAVAAGSIFNFTELTPIEAKLFMSSSGIPVRIL